MKIFSLVVAVFCFFVAGFSIGVCLARDEWGGWWLIISIILMGALNFILGIGL